MILGFHLGGKGKIGGCGIVTQSQVKLALAQLEKAPGFVLTASSGTIILQQMGTLPEEVFGKPVLKNSEIHPKSALNFLPEGANVECYGSMHHRATPSSKVVPTLISETVEKVCGVKQQWGPPKMKGKGVYPYQASLAHASHTSKPIGSVLLKAVTCYKQIAKQ
jgi:hypothetical protein